MPTRATVATRESGLKLRKTPSTSGETIIEIPKGSTVEVLGENGNWTRVLYLEPEKMVKDRPVRMRHEGWCSTEYLDFHH